MLRDPTRGGVATSLNEIARASKVGVRLQERALPIPEVVANACAFLGLDPLQVANEGKLLAFVPRSVADDVLAAMRAHPAGAGACVIGEVRRGPPRHGVDDAPASAPRGWSTCRSASSCPGSVEGLC